jgi:DNA polymerase, archaea type
VILRLMGETIEADDGLLISADTDGLYFSHSDPQRIFNLVSDVLPSGISIELEKSKLVMFSLSKKNYCLYTDDGELIDRKGNSLISHQTPIEAEFTKTYPKIYIKHGQPKADDYYHQIFNDLLAGNLPVEKVATTAKILSNWQTKIINLGLSGSSAVTYYYTRHDYHPLAHNFTRCRTYNALETLIENHPSVPYFGAYYAHKIEVLRSQMLNLPVPNDWWKKKQKHEKQLKLCATK